MAQEKNLWAKHRVNVELTQFKSAAQAFPALLSGQVDVIQGNPSEALLATEKGAELSIIGSTMPGLNYVLYAKPSVGSVSDLAGATLGISTPNALPTVAAKAILMASGVDPSSVKLVNAGGSPDRYRAVVGGVVDAASSPLDYVAQAKVDGVKVLATAKDTVPQFPRYASSPARNSCRPSRTARSGSSQASSRASGTRSTTSRRPRRSPPRPSEASLRTTRR